MFRTSLYPQSRIDRWSRPHLWWHRWKCERWLRRFPDNGWLSRMGDRALVERQIELVDQAVGVLSE